jgi:hypothetical protein
VQVTEACVSTPVSNRARSRPSILCVCSRCRGTRPKGSRRVMNPRMLAPTPMPRIGTKKRAYKSMKPALCQTELRARELSPAGFEPATYMFVCFVRRGTPPLLSNQVRTSRRSAQLWEPFRRQQRGIRTRSLSGLPVCTLQRSGYELVFSPAIPPSPAHRVINRKSPLDTPSSFPKSPSARPTCSESTKKGACKFLKLMFPRRHYTGHVQDPESCVYAPDVRARAPRGPGGS